MAAWRASGQKVPEFGKAHGIPASTLYQWIRGHDDGGEGRRRAKPRQRPSKGATAFTEVKVVGPVQGQRPAVTVTLRSGHSVTLEGGLVDPGWLGSVLEVMARC